MYSLTVCGPSTLSAEINRAMDIWSPRLARPERHQKPLSGVPHGIFLPVIFTLLPLRPLWKGLQFSQDSLREIYLPHGFPACVFVAATLPYRGGTDDITGE